MHSVKVFIEWIKKRLFPISIVIFILIYIWWFRLTPWNPQNDCCSNFKYRLGLILLAFYGSSGILWWLAKNRTCLGMFFGITTIFLFTLNSLCIAVFLPRIIETAKYNGALYYLVSYSTWPESPWTIYQLTKWQGFKYDSHDVGINGGFEIRYDERMQLVNVVKVFPTKYERLVYSDGVPPRSYAYAMEVDFEGKRYYQSYECNQDTEYPYLCETYTYMLYQCEEDNTLCKPLPLRYTGDYAFEVYIDRDSVTNDVNIYFDIGDYPGTKTLIFIDGDHPRCYVEGCEILETPK